MAALSAPRSTPRMGDSACIDLVNIPMKASTKIYQGAIVVSDAGYAAPARTATGLIAWGRAEDTVDNTAGSAGALTINVRRGTFKFDNSASGDLIAQVNIGASVFLVDDHTVALTSNSAARSTAGVVMQVDSDGVWVQLGNLSATGV